MPGTCSVAAARGDVAASSFTRTGGCGGPPSGADGMPPVAASPPPPTGGRAPSTGWPGMPVPASG